MDVPITGIWNFNKNDVLCGKSKLCQTHYGNIYFRSLIKGLKNEYISVDKNSKKYFAERLVMNIQSLQPPGRFLKLSAETGLWQDIGFDQALFKTRQALREGAPRIELDIKLGIIEVRTVGPTAFSLKLMPGMLENMIKPYNLLDPKFATMIEFP